MFEGKNLYNIEMLSVPGFLFGWPVNGLKILPSRQNAFVFTVITTGADTFQLPIYNGGTYDFVVRWGDGTSDTVTAYDDVAANHSYSGAGTYTVRITGTINGWRFNNAGDKTLIHDISSWGPLLLGNSNGYFYGCSNLTVSATDVLDVSAVTTFEYAFYGCSSLTTLDVSAWNTAAVTDFSHAFRNCSSLTTLDVSAWNTAAVTTFSCVFYDCSSLTTLDVSAWNTAAVTNFSCVFHGCSSLTTLDVSAWNTAAVTTFYYVFHGCSSLTTLDVSAWNTAAVTTFYHAFYGCSSLIALAANNWDITAVTTMAEMFVNVTLSTASYDALLIGWEAQAVQNIVSFHGGNSLYTKAVSAAATARQALIDDHTWTITDGGPTA